MKRLSIWMLLLALGLTVGCSDSGSETPQGQQPPVEEPKEEPQEPINAAFEVKITKATPNTVYFTVTPEDQNLTYFCNRTTETGMEQAGSLEACIMENVEALSNDDVYGDMLDSYLYSGIQDLAFSYSEVPAVKHYLYVAPIQRADDEERTPSLVGEPQLLEVVLPPYPVLTINPTTVDPFTVQAGSCTFNYAVEQPLDGCTVQATLSTGSEWIENLSVNADGTISFDYQANPHPVERKGEIIVTYDYAEWCYFTCSQVANEQQEQVTFELSLKESHYDRVVVDCIPSDGEVTYALGAVSKSEFGKYPFYNDPNNLIKALTTTSITYPKPDLVQGEQRDFVIDGLMMAGGTMIDWVVFAYAVDQTQTALASEVETLIVALVDEAPELAWDDEQVADNHLTIPAAGGTYTVKYRITNPIAGGVLKVDDVYESTNNGFLEKKPEGGFVTHDAEACTITFTATQNTTDKVRSLSIHLAYYSSEDDTFSEDNLSLSLQQTK